MKLNELAEYASGIRGLMSWMLLRDKKYLEEVERGLPFFREQELLDIEGKREFSSGLAFEDVNKLLSRNGMILKLPTFKKYLSLKLISGSTGRRQSGKASIGLYPPKVIREINFIKYALFSNFDLERAIERFQTDALEIIKSLFPFDLSVMDFGSVCSNSNEFGEGPEEAIERIIGKLLDQNLITEEKAFKINRAIEAIYESNERARNEFLKLIRMLDEIQVSGSVGLDMLFKSSNKKV